MSSGCTTGVVDLSPLPSFAGRRCPRSQLRQLKRERDGAAKIINLMKRNFFRRKYLRLKTAVRVLQTKIRAFLFWRRMLRSRRTFNRPIIVRVLEVDGLASPYGSTPNPYIANPFVIMTVSPGTPSLGGCWRSGGALHPAVFTSRHRSWTCSDAPSSSSSRVPSTGTALGPNATMVSRSGGRQSPSPTPTSNQAPTSMPLTPSP